MRAFAAVALLMQGGCLAGFEWESWEPDSGDTGDTYSPYNNNYYYYYRTSEPALDCGEADDHGPTTDSGTCADPD